MSWCRFGSPCDNTMPTMKDDVDCTPGGKCPGSQLYIYESTDGGYECCFCRLFPKDDFRCDTQEEMQDHIEAHVAAGHVAEIIEFYVVRKQEPTAKALTVLRRGLPKCGPKCASIMRDGCGGFCRKCWGTGFVRTTP